MKINQPEYQQIWEIAEFAENYRMQLRIEEQERNARIARNRSETIEIPSSFVF
jgi:hypothetical protein